MTGAQLTLRQISYRYQHLTLSCSSEVKGMAFACMYDSHARHSLSSTCPIYCYFHASMIGNGKDTLEVSGEMNSLRRSPSKNAVKEA